MVRGLPRFDGRAAFSTWCYRVATNACLDELRRRARRPRAGPPRRRRRRSHAVVDDGRPRLDETVADRIDIDAALAELSEEFRAPVVLRDLCQLDYAEIAEVLGIPAGTVRSRIARGRAARCANALVGNPHPPRERPTTRS